MAISDDHYLIEGTFVPSDVSRASTISVSAYLRTAQCVQGQDDMGNDLLMARVELTPALDGRVRINISLLIF